MRKTLAILAASLLVLTGCFTGKQQINVAAAYSFEGRYGTDTEIRIDGKKINYSESVWVLSNKTLYSILTTANPNKRDTVLLENSLVDVPTIYETPSAKRSDIDDFCNEEYVWEKWTVSTNAVSF